MPETNTETHTETNTETIDPRRAHAVPRPLTGDFPRTPGQTVGPFFHYALPYDRDRELVHPGHPGEVRLHGFVFDGAGVGLQDALVEIRQTDPSGVVPEIAGSLRRDGRFTGWGRCSTDRTGYYWFRTLEPGPAREGGAAFFALTVFARGLLDRLFTRIYLPAEGAGEGSQETALGADPLLSGLQAGSAATLLATREPDGALRFDIHLQGEHETTFIEFPRHRG